MYGPTETPRAGGPKGEGRHRSATGRSEHVPTSPTTATPAPSMTLEHDRGGGVGPLTWLSGYAALQQAGRRVAATPRAAPRRLQPNDGRPGDTTTRLTLFAQPGRPCTNASAPAGHSSTAQPRAREACSDESGAARTQTGQELGPGDNRPTSVPLLCMSQLRSSGPGPSCAATGRNADRRLSQTLPAARRPIRLRQNESYPGEGSFRGRRKPRNNALQPTRWVSSVTTSILCLQPIHEDSP